MKLKTVLKCHYFIQEHNLALLLQWPDGQILAGGGTATTASKSQNTISVKFTKGTSL